MHLLLTLAAFAAPLPPGASAVVATSAPSAGASSPTSESVAPTPAELRKAYTAAQRKGLTNPSPATHRELALLAIELSRAGVSELDGEPTLVRAGSHLGDMLVSNELRTTGEPPAAWLEPAWKVLDRLLAAGTEVADPAVALHVQATAARVAARFRAIPSATPEREGWPGSEWHREAARVDALFALDPGGLSLVSHLWVAEVALASCPDSYGEGGGGYEEVAVHLRATAPRSADARRRVSRAWASHHECALQWRSPETTASPTDPAQIADRLDHAERLVQAALDGAPASERAGDPDVAWWVELGFTTLLDSHEAAGDHEAMLGTVERMLAAPVAETAWETRALLAFDGAIRARQLVAGRDDLSLAGLEEAFARADSATDRGFEQLYRADLATLDTTQRQSVLDALQTYADVCTHYRDMPDRAARAVAVADRLRSLPDPAAVPAPTPATTPARPWPDAVEILLGDVRILAGLAIDARLPGDVRGERFSARAWVLRDLDGLVARLERRAALPGTMGDDARQAHVEALTWLGLSHAAAGDPAGAHVIFDQAAALDAPFLDIPLSDGETPRAWMGRLVGATPAEVRPLLLRVPSGAGELGLGGDDPAPGVTRLAELDLAAGYRGWLGGGAPDARWTIAFAPVGEGVVLEVGHTEVTLPDDEAAVVGRLEPLGSAWAIAPEPVPVPEGG